MILLRVHELQFLTAVSEELENFQAHVNINNIILIDMEFLFDHENLEFGRVQA
jgi:hypothetical protein